MNQLNIFKVLPFFILGFVGFSGLFIVHQTEQAIVLQFGELTNVHSKPGLKYKIPFIQDVIYYENRVLSYDLPPIYVTTVEQKRLVIDAYVRYQIKDAIQFFKSVKPSNETGAKDRLNMLVVSSVRNILGKVSLPQVLNKERTSVMKQIQDEVASQATNLGLEIVDVRIIRTELPQENRNAVFNRMNAELARFAKENRAKGEEIAQGIRARSDTEKAKILAEAEQESKKIKGEADAEAIKITNEAFSKDPKLYNVIKSLEAYEKTLSEDTNVVISTDIPFFNYFKTTP
ncbi:MAG: protease modulator HflC [Proteobacteria bacterium]|nr:protease modulator HflC [Pseudomonadota bacterium]